MTSSSWGSCLGLLYLAIGYNAYPNGAPLRQCTEMRPYHRPLGKPKTYPTYMPQTGSAPYSVTAEKQADQVINVKLNGTQTFKGFFVQAREGTDLDKLVPGSFIFNASEIRSVNCNGVANTAITHTSNVDKTEISTSWIGPAGYNGSVIFRATVVERFTTFWLDIRSAPLNIDVPETSQTTQPSGCGVTVSCLELPGPGGNIGVDRAFLTYGADKQGVFFELSVSTILDNVWIASGLSESHQMGPAHVVECLLNNDQVIMRESWNHADKVNTLITPPTPGLVFKKKSFVDGTLTCSWHRAHATTVRQITFDTEKNTYHILVASGPFKHGTTDKLQHFTRVITSERLNLRVVQSGLGGECMDVLVKVHGSLMIISWILLVSVGILLARHFKNVWPAETLCNQKVWFAVHRGLMLASVSMMVASLFIIFYRVGGWSSFTNFHPILGVICSTLAVLQPVTAFFRCHPGDERRYIFNWIHWFNGNVAHLTALATIFLATGLDKAKLKSSAWFVYVLAAFLIFHALVHTGMQVYTVAINKARDATDIRAAKRPAADLDAKTPSGSESTSEPPLSGEQPENASPPPQTPLVPPTTGAVESAKKGSLTFLWASGPALPRPHNGPLGAASLGPPTVETRLLPSVADGFHRFSWQHRRPTTDAGCDAAAVSGHDPASKMGRPRTYLLQFPEKWLSDALCYRILALQICDRALSDSVVELPGFVSIEEAMTRGTSLGHANMDHPIKAVVLESDFKKLALGIYVLFSALAVAALLSIIWFGSS
ncbi:hypothetical protein ISCGN_030696 [Ixodes scapularis]